MSGRDADLTWRCTSNLERSRGVGNRLRIETEADEVPAEAPQADCRSLNRRARAIDDAANHNAAAAQSNSPYVRRDATLHFYRRHALRKVIRSSDSKEMCTLCDI